MQQDTEAEERAARRGRKGPRNKPTLSCMECVSRKTKCDRGRPQCFSCVRRLTECSYTRTAEAINAAGPTKARRRASGVESDRMPVLLPAQGLGMGLGMNMGGVGGVIELAPSMFKPSRGTEGPRSDGSSPRVQREKFTLFPPFEAKQHPFGNYWTCIGGLAEVVGVLPTKAQADMLIARYFECVDPLYPIVSRSAFAMEYEYFWSLPPEERGMSDAAHLALQFAMYACAMHFVTDMALEERSSTSEFYISASHQSLCLFSYLSRCSLATMQTMVLICHFLINNNHVSDAWTFSGMLQRLAYGLGLHRNPDEVSPGDAFAGRQQRCRLWHATMFQDTNLCLYTELPPATSYHDLDRSCLDDTDGDGSFYSNSNPEANGFDFDTEFLLGMENGLRAASVRDDINYLQATWDFAQLAQTHLCIPKALRRAVCRNTAHKAQLIAEFRQLHQSWAWPFNALDPKRFEGPNIRLVLQSISVTSAYFWLLMHIYMDNDETAGVESNFNDALEAAHEGLAAFFALVRIYPSQADVWCASHTRAYDQATTIATILSADGLDRDPRRMLAKSDLERYIDIIIRAKGSAEFENVRKKRLAKLEGLRAEITYV